MGNLTQLERDEWGRVVVVIDAKDQRTRFAYQTQTGRPFHEPSHIHYADGSIVERQWNSEGLLVSQKDPTGQSTSYQYGPFDQLLSVTDPLGNALTLHYDSLERLSDVTNALGEQWQFQVVKETDFAGRTTELAYNPAGQLVARLQSDGQVTRYRYDDASRLVWQGHYPADCPAAKQPTFNPESSQEQLLGESHFSHDARGLLVSARNADSEITFKRDAAGRVPRTATSYVIPMTCSVVVASCLSYLPGQKPSVIMVLSVNYSPLNSATMNPCVLVMTSVGRKSAVTLSQASNFNNSGTYSASYNNSSAVITTATPCRTATR